MSRRDDPNVVQIRLTGTREQIDEVLKDMQLSRYAIGRLTDPYPQRGSSLFYAVYVHLHRMSEDEPPA
jgi:hypothetical protein